MRKDAFILTEGDDEDTPMSNVISLMRPAAAEALLLGDIVAGIIIPDLAVRLSGDFKLPKLVVRTGREDNRP